MGFRHEIGAGDARGIMIRSLVNPYVSSCIATGGSRLLDAIRGIRLVRFGTRKVFGFSPVSLSGRSGLGGLVGGVRGGRGSPGAGVYRYDDGEGGLFGLKVCLW